MKAYISHFFILYIFFLYVYSEQQIRHREFLERLRQAEDEKANSNSNSNRSGKSLLAHIRSKIPFWQHHKEEGDHDEAPDRDSDDEIDNKYQVDLPKETGLLWTSWYESVYCYSKIAKRVNELALE